MISEDFEIVSEGGIGLHGKFWLPASTPNAILCIVHGLGDHLDRFEHFAAPFVDSDLGLYGIDLRGHGLSEGKKGDGLINDFTADVQELVITARKEFNDLPIFLYGHSFGGLLVSQYLIKVSSKEIAGAIISAPWISLAMPVPPLKYKAASLLKKILPGISFSNEIDAADLANDIAVGEKYVADPLVHNKISPRLFFDIQNASGFVLANASRIRVPSLICHGSDDSIMSVDGSEKLARLLPSAELQIWTGDKHEPHNDFNKQEVIDFYIRWIIKNI